MADPSNPKQAQDNRAFNEMLKSAKKRLEQRPADDLAARPCALFLQAGGLSSPRETERGLCAVKRRPLRCPFFSSLLPHCAKDLV